MKVSIIIPHYAVGTITAYSVAQILKCKGKHEVQIVVIDNNYKDGSWKYLLPFMDEITFAPYPEGLLQSHGVAISWAIEQGLVKHEWMLTMENDAFPILDDFLSYYEDLINEGYDAAGSLLKLSGGTYLHGCGGLFSKSTYKEANDYVKSLPYTYFPNMAMKNNFPCHLMIHNSILDEVLSNTNDWIELSVSYKGLTKDEMLNKAKKYSPVNNAFHGGMGGNQEELKTYGNRNAISEVPNILINNKWRKLIFRMGYEPHQMLYYFMLAKGKKIFEIPTEIKWMDGRENQQQEFSINEAGIKHLWAVSSYTERGSKDVEDVYELKRKQPELLYNSLPTHQKIKTII